MADVTDIKAQIEVLLGELVTATTLGQSIVDDYKVGIFQRDFGAYPVAILTTPSIDSSIESSNGNQRTYTFEIIVIQLGDNITSSADIETLQEAVLDKFDAKPTLNNTAQRSEANVSVPAAAVSAGGKHFVAFSVTVKAVKIKQLVMT